MSRAMRANREQVWLLPPSIDEWVASNHPVRFVAALASSTFKRSRPRESSRSRTSRTTPSVTRTSVRGAKYFRWRRRRRVTRLAGSTAATTTIARCEKSTKATTGRTIKRLDTEDAFARQVASQSSPAMRILLSLRKEIVEHIFGIVKTVDGFRRFTARGLARAGAQWALVCLAINLRKLLPAWNDGRLRLANAATRPTG